MKRFSIAIEYSPPPLLRVKMKTKLKVVKEKNLLNLLLKLLLKAKLINWKNSNRFHLNY
jgi:hypothetical protein